MNCKNSAQNALKVTIFRLKIENFFGEGAPNTSPIGEGDTPSPNTTPLGAFGASILVCKSWIRHCDEVIFVVL